jgi:hypothetical protein
MEDPGLEDLGDGRTSGAPLAYTNLLLKASFGGAAVIAGPKPGLEGTWAAEARELDLGGNAAPLA